MVRLLIRFSEEQVPQPIASQIIIENKVPIAILSAHMNSKGGEMLTEVPDEATGKNSESVQRKRNSRNSPKLIEVDSEKCFSCGSCVALCPVEAITSTKTPR